MNGVAASMNRSHPVVNGVEEGSGENETPVARTREDGHTLVMGEWPEMRSPHEHLLASVEEMKRELRERAQRVAERERELEELRERLQQELGRAGGKSRRGPDRAELDARERQLEQRERALVEALGQAERREREAAAELALAQAERERLDERERVIHQVERELAGLRVALEERQSPLGGNAPEPPPPAPAEEPEPDAEPEPAPPTPLPQPPIAPDLEPAAQQLHHTRRR